MGLNMGEIKITFENNYQEKDILVPETPECMLELAM